MDARHVRALSVLQWREMALSGHAVPVRIQVNGSSMSPLIRRQRDYVTIVPMDRPPRVGDIVLFPGKRIGGDYVLHRVFKVEGQRMLTLGDGCLRPDGWMDVDKAWGRVIRVERGRLVMETERWGWRGMAALWVWLYPMRGGMVWMGRAVRKIARMIAKW